MRILAAEISGVGDHEIICVRVAAAPCLRLALKVGGP